MSARWIIAAVIIAAAGLAPYAGSQPDAQQQQLPGSRVDPDPSQNLLQEGLVEARGPVHEAFAQPVTRQPEPAPVVPKQPPEAIEELPPETKPEGDHIIWAPGYWAWDDDRQDYLWVSGIWRAVPPERIWIAGYWHEVDGGWQRVAGYWGVTGLQAVERVPEPPQPVAEAPPPAPAVNAIYVPGTWIFVQSRFAWRPGYWITPRPGWVWIYPCYLWTPAGCVFVDGYWDYDVPRRGVLFAPMYFEARVRRPGWWFRPAYCVPDDVLLTALFVRTSWHQYFFGDYFEPRYEKLGYRAWIDYRVGGRFPDPLYAYEHWRHRDNPRWEQTLRTTYVGRREGTVPRPPRDLVQQQKTNVNVLVSVKQYKSPAYTMTPVSKTQLQQIRQTSEQLRVLSQKRSQAEVQTWHKQGGAKNGAVKIEVPHPKIAVQHAENLKAPPAPPVPKANTSVQPTQKGGEKRPVIQPPKKIQEPPQGKDQKPLVKPPKEKIEPPKLPPKEKVEPPKLPPPPPPKAPPPPKDKVEPPKTSPPPPPKREPPPKPPAEVKQKSPPPKPKDDPKGKPPPKDDKKSPPDDDVARLLPVEPVAVASQRHARMRIVERAGGRSQHLG